MMCVHECEGTCTWMGICAGIHAETRSQPQASFLRSHVHGFFWRWDFSWLGARLIKAPATLSLPPPPQLGL